MSSHAPDGGRRHALGRVLCAVAASTLPALARPSPARVEDPVPVRGTGYRLVQDWDFVHGIRDLAALRERFYTRYLYDDGRLDHLNDEWQRYRDQDNHVFEDEGLGLVARAPRGVAPGQIESGMLRSRWSGQYGYFECRMKVPRQRGLWPAFWLNPQDGLWPPEIDVVEIVHNDRGDSTRNSFHFLHPGQKRSLRVHASRLDASHAYRPGFDYADGFHRFAVEWLPGRVRHFVDDVLVADRDFPWQHKDGSDGGPAHVLLNLAVGGNWTGAPGGPRDFPATLLASHIRVWQR